MRRRHTWLLLVYVAFAGAAALCPAGVVVHGCPLDGGGSCTHEADCPGDPCQLVHHHAGGDAVRVIVTPALPIAAPAAVHVPPEGGTTIVAAGPVTPDVLVPPPPPLLC